jgi:hypothetical protein
LSMPPKVQPQVCLSHPITRGIAVPHTKARAVRNPIAQTAFVL